MAAARICIRRVAAEEVRHAYLLQDQDSGNDGVKVPEEELELRQREAPDLFWGYFENGRLIGFASGSKTSDRKRTADTTFAHDPDGNTVALHTLRVHRDFHGKGIETVLVDHLLWYIEENLRTVRQVSLVCSGTRVHFYEGLQFRCLGPSKASQEATSKQWFDMEYRLSYQNTGLAF